jgi:hypothetical protein
VTRVLRNAVEIVTRADARLLELCNYVAIAVWGLWLVLPIQTTFSANAFALMRSIVPDENFWGWLGLAIGLAGIAGVLTGRHYLRIWASGLSFLFWLLITVSVGTNTTWGSTGVPIYGVRALFTLAAYSRLTVTAKATRD